MARKVKPVKSPEARAREAEMIREQLDQLGFPEEALRAPRGVLEAFRDEGRGATEEFRYPDLGVSVVLQLSVQPHVVSFARVRRLTTQRGC